MPTSYIQFTDEQKEQARRMDLTSLLKNQGETLKRAGGEYEWNYRGEKITLRGNLWYNQYTREGGDAITFVQQFYNMYFSEAVELLLSEQGFPILSKQENPSKEKKPFLLPSENIDMRRVYAYLLKARFLDREVVGYFVKEKLLYEDAEFHNAVFVGVDENGIARHAHKRGTYSDSGFKGNVDGCDPKYSFHYLGKGNRLYVFEAPIDMLSYISTHKIRWRDSSYVALCCVAPHAAVHILKKHPQIDTVITCLDHDSAGIEGNYRIKEAVQKIGAYKVISEQPEFKDWNEVLKSRNGLMPLPAAEHPGLARMKELCKETAESYELEICPKHPIDELRQQYQHLKRLTAKNTKGILKQSFEMAGIAFLLAKRQFASMEKTYTAKQYEIMLLRLYAPHRDHTGYKGRIHEIGERLESLKKAFQKNEILPESAQMEQIKNTLSLSVDCLRLNAYVEREQIETQRRESPCQTEQSTMVMQQ